MKRDWDLIREVLIEVEALDPAKHENKEYGPASYSSEPLKDSQAIMLWKAGFIGGADASSSDGDAIIAIELSWAGHELLDSMRSKAVWEHIKATAQAKGIELTFDSVRALGKLALDWVIYS
ncbi:hypothetical protein ALP39_200383 [Pseudomonas marginalis pv. marginalis]|nr:hypothetical protein ALP39_200383 [Pseudomonas marginalis pv. marginalis]